MNRKEANKIIEKHSAAFGALPREAIEAIEYLINAEPCREADDYENEIADLQNRLDIAEYDRDRWKEKVTVLEEKLKSLSAEPCEDAISRQAARKIILDEFEGWPTDEEVAQLKRLTKQIDELPSVTPKVAGFDDAISRRAAIDAVKKNTFRLTFAEEQGCEGHVAWSAKAVYSDVIEGALLELPPVMPKQIDVIDNIRAEVAKNREWWYEVHGEDYAMPLDGALSIIDKYISGKGERMTREERLDWLCRLRSGLVWFNVPPKERPMFEDVLSEEIKALSAEPCEDCISRQAVLTYIEFILTHGMGKKKSFEFIKKYVERQPSITPKQKMGRWLAVENEDMHTVDYFCSECDLPLETEERTPFCPNCGKKMEVEENG